MLLIHFWWFPTLMLIPSNNTWESHFENASRWKCNKLHLNINNIKIIMFGTHKCLHKTSVVHVKLNGVELEQVYQYKYFGLLFYHAFTWDKHADILCAELAERIGILRWVRNSSVPSKNDLDLWMAWKMYNALILPIFDYCNTIVSNRNTDILNKLQRLQNWGGRVLL